MTSLRQSTTSRTILTVIACVISITGLAAASPTAPGPPSSAATTPSAAADYRFEVTAETRGEAIDMTYWLGDDAVRFDAGDKVSMIWIGGDDPRMYIVQHDEKRYMVWGKEQFEMIRRMMERMPSGMMPGSDEPDDDDTDIPNLRFIETGNRDQIGDWDAFEVEVQGLREGKTAAIWLTDDLDVGLMEVFAKTVEFMDSMKLPAMMAGQGGGVDNPVQRFRALAQSSGLPDGRAVRVVNTDDGETSVMTLRSIGTGPFSFDPFGAPGDDYEEMRMPMMPR